MIADGPIHTEKEKKMAGRTCPFSYLRLLSALMVDPTKT